MYPQYYGTVFGCAGEDGMDKQAVEARLGATSTTISENRFKCPQCDFRGKWMFMIRKHQQVRVNTVYQIQKASFLA